MELEFRLSDELRGMDFEKWSVMRFRSSLFEALFLLILLSSPALARFGGQVQESDRLTVRGRAVCLNEAGERLKGDCPQSTAAFGLVSREGKLYRFLAEDTAAAIFTDLRVRERELQVIALARSESRLEIIKVQSVKEGKLYDIYYFCEVCNITAYAPGPCACCREEMEFRETPAPEP